MSKTALTVLTISIIFNIIFSATLLGDAINSVLHNWHMAYYEKQGLPTTTEKTIYIEKKSGKVLNAVFRRYS